MYIYKQRSLYVTCLHDMKNDSQLCPIAKNLFTDSVHEKR